MTKKVCVIKGDDSSPEAVLPTVEILKAMGLDMEFLWPITGDEAIAKYSDGFPEEARQAVDEADCTLFGATGGRTGGLGYLRWGKKTYANFRPIKWVKGMNSPLKNPEGIDFVVVRENLEGLYPGREGDIEQLAPIKLVDRMTGSTLDTSIKGKFAVRIITEENTRNICHAACKLALKRKAAGSPGKVTVACKYNMLAQSDGLFRQIAEDTVKGYYPELVFDQLIVDNFAHQLIRNPQQFDVVVMPNEHGDVLADGAAALIGGLGLAPSSCIGDNYAYFEPVHGSFPRATGQNIINPTATILSAKMMLEYLGLEAEAQRLEKAVYKVYEEGKHLTRDQGGTASTIEFCAAVKANL